MISLPGQAFVFPLTSNKPAVTMPWKKCVRQRASFPCYSRCENLSVRCLRVLIRKVAEYLTLDRWQIIGGPFGNTALLGSNLREDVNIMG